MAIARNHKFQVLLALALELFAGQIITGSEMGSCSSLACNDLGSMIGTSLNQEILPCSDFYEFSCSNKNQKEFSLKRVEKKLNGEIARLLQQSQKPDEPKAVHQAKDAFAACMNEDDRKLQGNYGLKRTIEDLGGWPILTTGTANETKWEIVAGRLRQMGYSLLMKVNVNVDRRDQTRHIVVFDSMAAEIIPDITDHMLVYLVTIAAQGTFIHQVVRLLGGSAEDAIKQDTEDVLRFQIKLNQISTQTRLKQSRFQIYRVMTITELNKLTLQKVDWLAYLSTVFDGIKPFHLDDEVVILNVDYVRRIGELLAITDARVLRNYLIWRLVRDVAEDGDPTMVALNQKVQGEQAQSKLDTCIKEIKGFLGYAVTNLYLKQNHYRQHLAMAAEVVALVKQAYEDLINSSSWMDTPTKYQAKIKLKEMTPKLGFPDWVLIPEKLDAHYGKINLIRTSHFGNILRMSTAYSLDELSLIKASPDHNSWVISPLTANAFYHRTLNDIYIPIAFMDRPFLDPDWPMAAVFGGIGAVIGHEITHGFDDESLLLTTNKTLVPWWSTATGPRYTKVAECVIRQYDGYCPFPGTPNINDRYQRCAYQLWKLKHGREPLPSQLQTYTAEQVFFMNFAQVWCEDTPPTALAAQMMHSPNSPNKYRLLGSLENLQEFGDTFNCSEFFAINADRRKCDIW